MLLHDGWTETLVTGPAGSERVYRKAAGDMLLTLDADTADRLGGGDLDEYFEREWRLFMDVRRRHG